jgi:pentapeptide MXKDX repeat protein
LPAEKEILPGSLALVTSGEFPHLISACHVRFAGDINRHSISGETMKKILGTLMLTCALATSMAVLAQSGDQMKQDAPKQDSMKNDQMKGEMKKEKKPKKATKKDQMKKDDTMKHDDMKHDDMKKEETKKDEMKQN